jgi:hypothetical protein
MSNIPIDGANVHRELTPLDYKTNGDLTNASAEVALVVGSASKAEAFIQNKQYSLLWRDSDILFQSPRPISVFENTYILC